MSVATPQEPVKINQSTPQSGATDSIRTFPNRIAVCYICTNGNARISFLNQRNKSLIE